MYVVEPDKRSFIEIRHSSHFPIQNLPYGIFRPSERESRRVGVPIGDSILDLSVLEKAGKFSKIIQEAVFSKPYLNDFMSLGREVWTAIRKRLVDLLDSKNPELQDDLDLRNQCFHDCKSIILQLPVKVSEFTDFYSSFHHANNVGTMIRGPENALMPNWKHLPVAYHGRGSSVVLSGVDIHRPQGQIKPADSEYPVFSPTKRLDFELELGFFIGVGNEMGNPIPIHKAQNHIFGMVLVNDWSARDVQVWEYRPLGPFLSKNFATSISPWVITLDALEYFKTDPPKQDPKPLLYLKNSLSNSYNINLEVYLQTKEMKSPKLVTTSNSKYLYWNIAQQLAHHTITGCNMQTGDLCGSGTISGPAVEEQACLLELTELGNKPLVLTDKISRTFLEDSDIVIMTGYANGKGFTIGFGEVKTKILSAVELIN